RARQAYVERDGLTQPAPAPRFSRTPSELGAPPFADNARDTEAVLADWGFSPDRIAKLRAAKVL
ncbi:MAG: CoA transferase, partial [Rhodocyclaceae bacterium]|nr:CoA transferase [Rhodocyclaceae bacterium]